MRTIPWAKLLCLVSTARSILRWTASKPATSNEPFYHKEPGFPNSAGECSWGTPAHVSRMRSTCPHATGNRVKAGRAPDERGRCPQPNKTVPVPVHGSSLDQATRRRGASHRHPPSWLSPVHSPGCPGHCRARNDMAATQRRYRRQQQR